MLKKLIFLVALMVVAWGVPALAQSVGLDIRQGKDGEALTITVPTSQNVKAFTLSNPERLVVDVPNMPQAQGVRLPATYRGNLVRGVRTGQFDKATTRIVVELNAPAREVKTSVQKGKGAIITARLGAKVAPPKPEKPKEKPVVVIDAGHGGQDPGTTGPDGVREKDVVLQYALALKRELMESGQYKVYLTRDDDNFILLRERVALARKAKGALFISLHADSAQEASARGLSVYTLSEQASDSETEALAARENRVDDVYGLDLSDQSKDVADILVSLAQRDTNNKSAYVARKLVEAMEVQKVRLLPNTHRFAGFAVLKAPDIPSVLVEIGFLSHPDEENMLKNAQYRAKIIRGLAQGVDAYFAMRRENGEL